MTALFARLGTSVGCARASRGGAQRTASETIGGLRLRREPTLRRGGIAAGEEGE